MTFSVMIIGGGIGGLALAQGLRRAGIAGDVYERTAERTDWLQGYRIHINPAGARALHDCLAPDAWQSFLDSVSAGDGGFGFLTDRCTELLGLADAEINDPSAAPADRHYGVSRIRLRETLLGGLDDVLHPGKTFTGYRARGRPRLRPLRRRHHRGRGPVGRCGRRQFPGTGPAAALRTPGRHRRGRRWPASSR